MASKIAWYDWTAFVLLVVGGLNWGLALFDINLVTMLADVTFAGLATIVYGAVGVSALYGGYMLYKLSV
jgi:uncharacterized membrane protein YuzA (DUF378 family)